ncbi:MAG: 3'-5' exonuclease, partial [Candidatus Nitrotoga sp.]|nr:3'-5' exonuclease [Candidatus Nitrotoga sp.]
LPEVIDHILLHSGLLVHYQNETGVKQREAQERLENLNELINAATLFVHENEDDSLTSFLTHAALESGESQAEANADALHLMTVHSSKGLEFHTVFMSGLEEGLFPHHNSRMADAGVDEERRLMYVAITRARRRLYLSFAQSRMLHGQVNYNLMSSFLRELPEELLHWITPRITARNNFSSSAYSTPFTPKPSPISMKGLGGEKSVGAQNSPWHISQAVHHAKFGEGVIVNIESGDSDMRVQVNFRTAGTKWLALEYAKLTPL